MPPSLDSIQQTLLLPDLPPSQPPGLPRPGLFIHRSLRPGYTFQSY